MPVGCLRTETIKYSCLHLLVDFLCAMSMTTMLVHRREDFLVYNFCAFALQLPFGYILDKSKLGFVYWVSALIGVFLTMVGVFTSSVILGIGNALFHVGAGSLVIKEDFHEGYPGKALGCFVAPGALGLWLGCVSTGYSEYNEVVAIAIPLVILVVNFLGVAKYPVQKVITSPTRSHISVLTACFIVVIIRSYVGMAVKFPWSGSLSCVLAVVFGKVAGGFLIGRFGINKSTYSLILASVLYLLSGYYIFGLLALFLFNMSMPLTPYLLIKEYPELPGTMFGLLTFGLFLGFIPIYLGYLVPVDSKLIGFIGSIISFLLLWVVRKSYDS